MARAGYGFVGGGKGSAVAAAIDEQMRDLVVGRSVFEAELIQEQLIALRFSTDVAG